MKRFVCILSFLVTALLTQAQGSWKIVLNNKLLISSHDQDDATNTKLIKSSDWKKNSYLEVTFKEAQPSTWHHSLRFTDEQDIELLVRDNMTNDKIRTSALRKLFAGKKQMKIYMVISPPDPMMAAPTRLIHLATLKLP